ncbi:MAG: hypothetical protein RBT15_02335 [Gudongella sp.]|jgi:hypothetical protein|nr:hypothetical protein [Gudongella sp.]
MYTFLILLGAGLVVFGMTIEMKEIKRPKEVVEPEIIEEIDELEESEEYEEENFFIDMLQEAMADIPEPEEYIREFDDDRMRLMAGLENGDYSLEMVCSMLGMEKGEVLLLKNIYRNYQK